MHNVLYNSGRLMTKAILYSALIGAVCLFYLFSRNNTNISYSSPDYEQEYYNNIVNRMNGKSRCDFMEAQGVDC